jgi:hypothetical protein
VPYNHIVRRDRYQAGPTVEEARQSALQAVLHLLLPVPGLRLVHRRELLTICLWKWTEASGKAPHAKYNIRYATPVALNHDVPTKINHEHVWTRGWIIDRLLQTKRPWTDESLLAFLEQYGVACIVTVEEHARLGSVTGEGWQRYARARIDVWDLATSAPFDLGAPLNPQVDGPPSADEGPAVSDIDWSDPFATDDDLESEPVHEGEQHRSAVDEQSRDASNKSVSDAFAQRSGAKAGLLKRLAETAMLAAGVCYVGETRNNDRSAGKYVRLHDAVVGEPTRAAAFLHWTGRVSLALVPDDLPSHLLNHPNVSVQLHPTYGVSCKVNDETSLKVAEALAVLALEKIRDGFPAAVTENR